VIPSFNGISPKFSFNSPVRVQAEVAVPIQILNTYSCLWTSVRNHFFDQTSPITSPRIGKCGKCKHFRQSTAIVWWRGAMFASPHGLRGLTQA
jgi:hypothetical protein